MDVCDWCNKECTWTDLHHLIPRWFDKNSNDVVYLCKSCHTRSDHYFRNFIIYGSFLSPIRSGTIDPKKLKAKEKRRYWKHREKRLAACREYHRKHHEELLVKGREYYYKNREQILAKAKERYRKTK